MKEKLLHERALVTCIAMLFICIILKLFGVQWFDLNTDIPILQEIDKVVMNSIPLSFLYTFVLRSINGYLIYIIVTKQLKINIIYFVFVTCLGIALTTAFPNNPLLFISDTLLLLILCFTYKFNKCIFKEYMFVFLLNILFQFISLFIRNLGYHHAYYGLMISVLLTIDYYIMLLTTYLYLKKGDLWLCSIVRHIGSSLANLLWKKRSENYSNKEGN